MPETAPMIQFDSGSHCPSLKAYRTKYFIVIKTTLSIAHSKYFLQS